MSEQITGTTDPFETADLYDEDDAAEQLIWSDWSEALERAIDSWAGPDVPIEQTIREHAPWTIYAYKRAELDDGLFEREAERLHEQAQEDFGDIHELGDPDGTEWPEGEEIRRKLIAIVKELYTSVPAWSCEVVGKRTWTADECLAWARVEYPEWFE